VTDEEKKLIETFKGNFAAAVLICAMSDEQPLVGRRSSEKRRQLPEWFGTDQCCERSGVHQRRTTWSVCSTSVAREQRRRALDRAWQMHHTSLHF
jgi:hypothetical protein